MNRINYIAILTVAVLMVACTSHPSVPANCSQEDKVPTIFPDYTEVTIPANIAPMNFAVREAGEECVARLSCGTIQQTYGDGKKVVIDEDEWHELLKAAKGGQIKVERACRICGN